MKPAGHRIIYTGDCGYLFEENVYNPGGGPYTAKIFHDHVDLLADSGVDTFLVNPNAQKAWYPSRKIAKVYDNYRRGDRDFFRGHIPCEILEPEKKPELVKVWLDKKVKYLNNYLDLEEAGIDWLAEIAAACRRRKISPWLSIRMNDIHGSGSRQGSFLNCDLYKDLHYCLKGESLNPRDGVSQYYQALNYEKREVRDYMFTLIRELIEDYDYEGIELDWLRNPFCCEPNASQDTLNIITGWIREIRELTEAKSRKTGKPYPLGLRIPGTLGLLRSIGLDVIALARVGLIDFVSPSNFWQTSWDMPHDKLREVLGENVSVFGVIENAPNWLPGYSPGYNVKKASRMMLTSRTGPRMLSSSAELMRGNAAGKLVLGADGIEFFNFFCTDSDEWCTSRGSDYRGIAGIDKLDNLRSKAKHYTFSNLQGSNWYPPFEMSEQLPIILEPQWRREFRLPMCSEPKNSNMELIIQLVIEKGSQPNLGVSFNGSWPNYDMQFTDLLLFPAGIYTHHSVEFQAMNFRFRADDIREGWNEITVYNNHLMYEKIKNYYYQPNSSERSDLACCIASIELAVKCIQ